MFLCQAQASSSQSVSRALGLSSNTARTCSVDRGCYPKYFQCFRRCTLETCFLNSFFSEQSLQQPTPLAKTYDLKLFSLSREYIRCVTIWNQPTNGKGEWTETMPPNEPTEHPATGMSHQNATTHCCCTRPVKSQHRAGVQSAQTQPPPDAVCTRASLTPSLPWKLCASHLFILVKIFLSLSCTGDPSWTDCRKPFNSSSLLLSLCRAVWIGEALWGTMNYPGFRISISYSDSINLSLAISVIPQTHMSLLGPCCALPLPAQLEQPTTNPICSTWSARALRLCFQRFSQPFSGKALQKTGYHFYKHTTIFNKSLYLL